MSISTLKSNAANNSQTLRLPNSGKPNVSLRPPHNPPKSLSQNEIQGLYDILGNDCVTLATAVVQIFDGSNDSWEKRACGVLCFVKDYCQRNYSFRLYDLRSKQCIDEEVVPSSIYLEKKQDLFYVFNGMNSKVGINFADNVEAEIFSYQFHAKQESRRKKRENIDESLNIEQQTQLSASNGIHMIASDIKPKSLNHIKKEAKSKSPHGKQKKDNRPIISSPVAGSFSVVMHIGTDESSVTEEMQRQYFEAVLSHMKLSSKDKRYVLKTIQNTEDGLKELFTKKNRDCNHLRQETSACSSENLSTSYFTAERTHKYRVPHQDIAVPSSIYQGTTKNFSQVTNILNGPTSPKRFKAPAPPPKQQHRPAPPIPDKNNSHMQISTSQLSSPLPLNIENSNPSANIPSLLPLPGNKENQKPIVNIITPVTPSNIETKTVRANIPQPPPLPDDMRNPQLPVNITKSPTPTNIEIQKDSTNIPRAPLPPTLPSEEEANGSPKASSNIQATSLCDEINNFNKDKLKPNAERTQIIKPPSTNKSNVEVQRTLEMNIFEMIAKRRPGIMGRDDDDESNEESDSDDEWCD